MPGGVAVTQDQRAAGILGSEERPSEVLPLQAALSVDESGGVREAFAAGHSGGALAAVPCDEKAANPREMHT